MGVILSRPPSEVQSERDEILIELTNVTKKHIIIDDIRYHVDGVGRIRMDWSDLLFHAVDPNTKNIVPVFDILNEIDSKYDFLKDYYSVSLRLKPMCVKYLSNDSSLGVCNRKRHPSVYDELAGRVRHRSCCNHRSAYCSLCRCDKLHCALLLPQELGYFDTDRDETQGCTDKEADYRRSEHD